MILGEEEFVSLLSHTIKTFLGSSGLRGVRVAIAQGEGWYRSFPALYTVRFLEGRGARVDLYRTDRTPFAVARRGKGGSVVQIAELVDAEAASLIAVAAGMVSGADPPWVPRSPRPVVLVSDASCVPCIYAAYAAGAAAAKGARFTIVDLETLWILEVSEVDVPCVMIDRWRCEPVDVDMEDPGRSVELALESIRRALGW